MTQAFPRPLRVLVSGGAGFIGSHLCKRLLDKGHIVLCLDNFHTGQIQHVESLRRHPRFRLEIHDVVTPFDAQVDRIYSLACPASPIHYQTQPVHTLRTCVVGALNMLELAHKSGARILQALQNQPITIYGDGSQTRAFCYVDEMVDALERLMESPEDFIGPVNLGNPEEMTMLDIARRVQRLAGTDVPVIFNPLPADDPTHRCPDISLAARELGWAPRIPIEDGLRHTIRYFSQFVHADVTRARARTAAQT